MTKLVLGDQKDDSSSTLSLDTDGQSNLEIRGGVLGDRSRQDVRVRDRSSEAPSSSFDSAAPASRAPGAAGSDDGWRRSLAVGGFLVIALAAIAAIFILITRVASPLWVPAVLVGSIVVLYLLASVILPKERVEALSGFAATLKDFMRFVFGKGDTDAK